MSFDFAALTDAASTWLATEGLALARNLLVFLLIVVAGMMAARIVRKAVGAAFERSRLEPSALFTQFVVNVSSKSVMLLALIIGLGNLGIDTGALIAGLGATGLVLGFALKDTLSNFAAGMLILLYRPFDVGHYVEINGIAGTVKDLTLVSTMLSTPDNKRITIPNSGVWGNPIINFSQADTRRVDIVAGIAYDADIDEAKAIFEDILATTEGVLQDPAPTVTMNGLGGSSVDFDLRGWVNTADFWAVRSRLLREVKYRLDAAGIGIPFPQQEVWMHQIKD
ncbi:mechanosensitive ion channel family protein [Bradymonadaceae bacterium TMQ3]|uniref:Mechanosensitive ion channel n=1 Tax=Lujinxingia sediminis TaxID=2480984 RepID=A0ABY0CSS6_9DELT|nr:mechanosensitive ion channel domain-containing protein [Lujinxingia sediminis]RDV38933.1 mechanosensitive ion channel family protein [Bradymonadaceae bacterium TMQ3]RVU44168.1 mechanosensitive ion channel [Lujinxingia sediminis]TXC76294.1 mechanosensitive ion channel [Bradymonadales bacterium TMQ1]